MVEFAVGPCWLAAITFRKLAAHDAGLVALVGQLPAIFWNVVDHLPARMSHVQGSGWASHIRAAYSMWCRGVAGGVVGSETSA